MTTAPTAPLNVFQQLMRRWDAVHPYNAAQAVRVRGTPDRDGLAAAWQSALAATGLGVVAVAAGRYRFESLNGHADAYPVRFPVAALAEHITGELNRRFDDPAEPPFRPFVVADGSDGFHAGVVYAHWVADSTAVRMLVREWFVRAYDPGAACDRPLRLPGGGSGGVVGRLDGWDVAGGLLDLTRRHCRFRRVRKVASTALADHATRFALFPTEAGLIGHVRRAAAGRRVKVNDLFLAALAEACDRHVPLQPRPNRTDLGVGSIVDLRPGCGRDLSRTFGCYLGFTHVACRPAELARFDTLVAAIGRQTRHQKAAGVATASLMWMSAALVVGRLSRPGELYHFYRKEMPLAGGVSNVDLSAEWVGRYAPTLVSGYVRVSPTGPMAPLVLTTTTLGDAFQIGLTHRTGLIDAGRAADVAGTVLARLRSL